MYLTYLRGVRRAASGSSKGSNRGSGSQHSARGEPLQKILAIETNQVNKKIFLGFSGYLLSFFLPQQTRDLFGAQDCRLFKSRPLRMTRRLRQPHYCGQRPTGGCAAVLSSEILSRPLMVHRAPALLHPSNEDIQSSVRDGARGAAANPESSRNAEPPSRRCRQP